MVPPRGHPIEEPTLGVRMNALTFRQQLSSVALGLPAPRNKAWTRLLIRRILSPTDSLRAGPPLLINGQSNERRLDPWRGDSAFPAAFYEISKNSVHFDPRMFCEVAIHRRGQFRTRCGK